MGLTSFWRAEAGCRSKCKRAMESWAVQLLGAHLVAHLQKERALPKANDRTLQHKSDQWLRSKNQSEHLTLVQRLPDPILSSATKQSALTSVTTLC